MEQKVIKKIVWSFVKNEQPEKALEAALKLKRDKKFDKFLMRIANYHLERIVLPKRFIWRKRKKLSDSERFLIFKHLNLAYETTGKIESLRLRTSIRKKIFRKGLECLKIPDGPIKELAEFLYIMLRYRIIKGSGFESCQDPNYFLKRVIKDYLKISHLDGREIVRVAKLLTIGECVKKMKKLIPVFIKRGDYEALELIWKTYGILKEEIAWKSEKIILSCLEKGKIKEAEEALSLIVDANKRQEYHELLSVDFESAEKGKKNN
ncbi:MAG: hypothetical protein WC458_00885 [Patescibacteria group bacterium]|jgi:hypothetical protein